MPRPAAPASAARRPPGRAGARHAERAPRTLLPLPARVGTPAQRRRAVGTAAGAARPADGARPCPAAPHGPAHDRPGPLQVKEILRIGYQSACGLAAAHAQGLIHRDIKPANILLENGVERVKLTDFGLARAVDDASLTQSGVVPGTPQYMSPEQAW